MTWPRRVVPGTTYLLTRRCTQRRFMLVPRGIVPKLFGYCVALAAERHGIQVHAITCMSNHWHAVVTDPHGRIPEFSRDVHSLTARALNAHLGRWEALWSSQRLSLVELVDAPDVWDKLVYTLTNPVEAGLVARSSEWPGLRTRSVDLTRHPRIFKRPRTAFFRRSRLPKTVRLCLTVPPLLEPQDARSFAQELQARVGAREAAIREQMETAGRAFMGPHDVKRQRRDARPKTHELRRGRHPAVASRDRTRRLGALERLRRFRDAYHAALERWRKGTGPVRFPEGTYKMRDYPGVMGDRAPPLTCQAA
jgi:REP element-mobilizing transposase RayT